MSTSNCEEFECLHAAIGDWIGQRRQTLAHAYYVQIALGTVVASTWTISFPLLVASFYGEATSNRKYLQQQQQLYVQQQQQLQQQLVKRCGIVVLFI